MKHWSETHNPGHLRIIGVYDAARASQEAAIECLDPSLTIQSQAAENDLNNIMERYANTGALPQDTRIPMYGDFTEITDYRSSLEAIRQADQAFAALPAKVRTFFDNDPQNLLEFAANPQNIPKLIELGLGKQGAPAPAPTPPIPPDPPKGSTTTT